VFVNVVAGLVAWQKRKSFAHSSIVWLAQMVGYLAILAVTELLLIEFIFIKSFVFYEDIKPILTELQIQDTNFIGSISYFVRFIFLGLFFRDAIGDAFIKKFFQVAIILLVIFELVDVFVFKSYQGYDSLSSTTKNIFIIGGIGIFLYKFYHTYVGQVSFVQNPYFWISLGLLLPAFCEIFLEFIFSKLYNTDEAMFYKWYIVRNISQVLGFVLLTVGFWKAKYLRFLPKEY
jgi:hypothetical protein